MPRAAHSTEPMQATEPLLAVVRPLNLPMHEVQVQLTLPAGAAAQGAVLALPAWTPGSYLIRDYARLLDRLMAADDQGRPLALEKLDKQRWRLPAAPGPVTLRYRLFCNDLTVRTNHVDAGHAHLVGAASFLYLEGQASRPIRVSFRDWPADWRVATALPADADGYLAADHDTLVDSPFELGRFRLHGFQLSGCDFQLAVSGEHVGDEGRILEGARAIAAVCAELFGGFPFSRYLFLLTFSPGLRGGLEHRDCTSLLADSRQLEKADGYRDLFTLIAHEFFHAWNVKRLRDRRLGPFDYLAENPTRLLWFHEGFTSFMQYSIVLRAGLAPWAWVARRLASSWTEYTSRAGRLEQSLEEASFDAWIRHYKPSDISANSTVSYYDKGALVGWLMDAQLRLSSAGQRGLDDLFAHLWARIGDGPLEDADLRAAYRELSGLDPEPFWERYVQGRAELDPAPVTAAYGLKFLAKAPWELLAGGEAEDPDAVRRARSYSGLSFSGDSARVANVDPGSPGDLAGLSFGAEILAVDGWRTASAAEAQRRLKDRGPGGEPAEVLATERGRVWATRLVPVEDPHRTVQFHLDPKAGPAQREAFRRWTGNAYPGSGDALERGPAAKPEQRP
jgi:predicted metalloprotease with PDZ domain